MLIDFSINANCLLPTTKLGKYNYSKVTFIGYYSIDSLFMQPRPLIIVSRRINYRDDFIRNFYY